MAAGGRHLKGPLGALLALDVLEIDAAVVGFMRFAAIAAMRRGSLPGDRRIGNVQRFGG
jgi:hypothetical protein